MTDLLPHTRSKTETATPNYDLKVSALVRTGIHGFASLIKCNFRDIYVGPTYAAL